MNRWNRIATMLSAAGLAALVGCGTAETASAAKPGTPAGPEMKLPPGWTEADMKACMEAGTPGKMHELLGKSVGTWQGNCTQWMLPGAEPMKSPCTYTVSSFMDGRFTKAEYSGDMPGMGPFRGFGLNGFDNMSGKFVGIWIDSQSTNIAPTVGELSADGKTINWTYSFTCPINKKPMTMKQAETTNGNRKTFEMWGPEPKSGQVYKMMLLELTRK